MKACFAALGQHGSIAVSERFLGSLERELWRRLRLLPLRVAGIEWHAASYLELHDLHGASSCSRGTDAARGA